MRVGCKISEENSAVRYESMNSGRQPHKRLFGARFEILICWIKECTSKVDF